LNGIVGLSRVYQAAGRDWSELNPMARLNEDTRD